MDPILSAVLSVSGIGIICAIMLTVSSKLMAVEEDERASAIREVLPGANCGACGYAGCDAYAEALAEGNAKTNLCPPGGDSVSEQISEILGVEFEDVQEMVAVCHCGGTNEATTEKLVYEGVKSCAAATRYYSGQKLCHYGCMGYGDCAAVCPTDAISIIDGLARINPKLCIGCGLCSKECPHNLINLYGDTIKVVVSCSSKDKGALVRKACKVGCIACQRCAKECPTDAIEIVDNLSVIDYDKCIACGRCVEVCPTNTIVMGDYTGALKR